MVLKALIRVASLDLDDEVGTRGLVSGLVSPVLDRAGNVNSVLAFYSASADLFSQEHHRTAEAFARLLSPLLEQRTQDSPIEVTGAQKLEHLISQVEGSKSWWPVGVIVTRIAVVETGDTRSDVWRVLRKSVKADDSLVEIDRHTFLLLLLKSSNSATRDVAARVQHELATLGTQAMPEWSAVDTEARAENQAFTSLADAIHHTAMEADGRTRRTTH